MPHSRPASFDRPLPVRLAFGLFRVCASLQLAVVLIAGVAVLLAWATFVESRYGAAAVRFGIYGTWWFTAIGALLALNIFCAAAARFPWKRRHTGFVVTHLGLLVLLAGCLVSRLGGIDATLSVFEGHANWRAFEDSQHFQLTVLSGTNTTSEPQGLSPRKALPQDKPGGSPTVLFVPFRAGPFNWDDYAGLFPFPWRLARRDRGVLYDRDGIKLEVLDYYADSKQIAAPRIELKVDTASGSLHEPGFPSDRWTPVVLMIKPSIGPHAAVHRFGMANRRTLPDGLRIVFWTAGSRQETEAFLDSAPTGDSPDFSAAQKGLSPSENIGQYGRIVLHAGGEKFEFSVDRLREQPRRVLGESGLELEFISFEPRFTAVRLTIHRKDGSQRPMVLIADLPDFNRQNPDDGVYGTFWFDATQEPGTDETPNNMPSVKKMRQAAAPRIDIIQGDDRRLYYRTWHSPTVGTIAPLPADGTEITVFDGTDALATLYVEKFLPLDKPGNILTPIPFERKKNRELKKRRAKVRLTVDGTSEEFWLLGTSADPLPGPISAQQRHVVDGLHRRVTVTMPRDQLDVGFQIYLHKFNRRLDPGTSQASHYSSLVDFLDRHDSDKPLQRNVLITLNAPVDFSDPHTGRSYRLFQASFRGPWRKDHPLFKELVEEGSGREQLFLSWLTVNYDPGRGLKYAGSLLIVAGIVIMYYMRAYFFGNRSAKC